MIGDVEKLASMFKEIANNYQSNGNVWKNIELSKQAFILMKSLPTLLEGEFDTLQDKAALLSQMLEYIDENSTPRFCIEVRAYINSLNPDDEDNLAELARLNDFIDPSLTMEDYTAKYKKHLKFDPVERSPEWENVIYHVEKECDEILRDEPHGMGFCFRYWSVKGKVLAKYGIDWQSPSEMNPKVLFD